jgi:hypothetical protein
MAPHGCGSTPDGGYPRRGRRDAYRLARMRVCLASFILRLFGWKFVGFVPDPPKLVVIGAPHTSNWDFPLGPLAARVAQTRISWIGKAGLFRFPWGPLMRWLGGIPAQRTGSEGLVEAMAERFAKANSMVVAIAPEGTRRAVSHWRSGFYRIAHAAGVPVVSVALDAVLQGPHRPGGDAHREGTRGHGPPARLLRGLPRHQAGGPGPCASKRSRGTKTNSGPEASLRPLV